MSNVASVAKNSLWLLVQPVLLNLLSLLAIPYIARTLGEADYGRFVLAFSIVTMLTPLANMGLRAVTVRQVAQEPEPAEREKYVANTLGARFFLALMTMVGVAVAISAMRYDFLTKAVACIAAVTLLTEAVTTTVQDVFYALERMRYVAFARFAGGLILTILSVAVLIAGLRVIAFTMTYLVGAFVTMALTGYYSRRLIGRLRVAFDWRFLRSSLSSGAPFFYPTIVASFCSKAGVSLLPLFGGVSAVGAYGAASALIDRLLVIPDGVCTAIYPTLAKAYKSSPPQAEHLFRRYFEYLLLAGLPIAVGTTLVAEPIIRMLFGTQYLSAIPVLKILGWWLCVTFLSSLLSWTLGAVLQEKKMALVGFITGPLGAILTLALLPFQHERAIAWANLGTVCLTLILQSYYVHTTFARSFVKWGWLARVFVSNAIMASLVYLVRGQNVAIPIAVGAVSYPFLCVAVGVVKVDELRQLYSLVLRRVSHSSAPAQDG